MPEKYEFIDTLKNAYDQSSPEKKIQIKQALRKILEDSFKSDLNAMVDRWLESRSMGIIDVTDTKFNLIWMESFMCYIRGFYYSTIALCGITAERLCMDILYRHQLQLDGKTLLPCELDSFFQIPYTHMVKILHDWNIINEDTKTNLNKVGDVRNEYVHPDVIPDLESSSGQEKLRNDALKILNLLKDVLSQSFPSNPH